MILDLETLEALKIGDTIKYWGTKRPIYTIGDVRQTHGYPLPFRIVEFKERDGTTLMTSLQYGDNGPICEEVEFA
jgi:hypothetical protein